MHVVHTACAHCFRTSWLQLTALHSGYSKWYSISGPEYIPLRNILPIQSLCHVGFKRETWTKPKLCSANRPPIDSARSRIYLVNSGDQGIKEEGFLLLTDVCCARWIFYFIITTLCITLPLPPPTRHFTRNPLRADTRADCASIRKFEH